MSQSYLNGRVTLSSLAAPSDEDKSILASLSEEDRAAVIAEAVNRADASGEGTRTPEEIWESAKLRAAQLKLKNAV